MSSFFSGPRARTAAPSKSPARLAVECLEDRQVPTSSISGHVVLDPTGNGYRDTNPAQAGVTVKLFTDTDGDGKLTGADQQVASQRTTASGAYSFTNLSAGRYFVSEATPSGHVRTAPAAQFYYATDLGDNQDATGQNFANFKKLNTANVGNITYTVAHADGTTATVTNLRGQTRQGDTVTANFTIPATASNVVVTLVTYNAPGASFNAGNAGQQVPIEIATGTFGPGQYSLTVHIPYNYYQVDFVLGSTIDQFGPAGGNIFYSAQGRLLSADNSGSQSAAPTLTGMLFDANNLPPSGPPGSLVLTATSSDGSRITGTLDTTTGFFSFAGLQSGVTYTLTVADSSGRYETHTSTFEIINGVSITHYDIILFPSDLPPT